MRILPVLNKISGNIKTSKTQTRFESKNNTVSAQRAPRMYTGIPSVDLAYVSMFDNSIAKDLKMMGLI